MKSYSKLICPFATLAVRIPAGMRLFHIQYWFCGVKEGWVTSSGWDFKNFGAQSTGSALTVAETIRRCTSASEGTNEAVSGGAETKWLPQSTATARMMLTGIKKTRREAHSPFLPLSNFPPVGRT